ncbi:pseudouridine synthase [Eionea flava]
MPSVSHRLDRFIARELNISKSAVRELLIQKKIVVDGNTHCAMNQPVGRFTSVIVDGKILQQREPLYLMLHKPKGTVSATKDDKHQTVIDLIDHPEKSELHIAGRLDFNTTGLLLLTNDGAWSQALSLPDNNVNKIYRVTLQRAIDENNLAEYRRVFREGIYLTPEKITTRPATLDVISPNEVELSICEGRYHQVKRMFGFFRNEVCELHRIAIGHIELDKALAAGECRSLTLKEVNTVLAKKYNA